MAHAYLLNECYSQAVDVAARGYEASQRIPQVAGLLACMHAANGNKAEAKKLLQVVMEAHKQRYVRALDIATIHCGLHDRKQALTWLNSALEERTMHFHFSPIDPRFRWLHSDPEFHYILQRVGLQLAKL